jgi:hypothetical protein
MQASPGVLLLTQQLYFGIASVRREPQTTGCGWRCKGWAEPFPWFEYHLSQRKHVPIYFGASSLASLLDGSKTGDLFLRSLGRWLPGKVTPVA